MRDRAMRIAAALVAIASVSSGRQARAEPRTSPVPPSMAACMRRIHRPCLTPALIQAAYGVDTLFKRGIRGQGRTIAIVVSYGSPALRTDLHQFDAAFGLPDPHLSILAPLGTVPAASHGWAGETTLDVEWAHAMAPQARIVVLESPVDETEGVQGLPEFLQLEQYALEHQLADVISQSWGATEDTLFDAAGRRIVDRFHRFYGIAAARGITVVASSGDEGAAGVDRSLKHFFPGRAVSYPASDPLVLSVGGTRLRFDARGGVLDETAWPGSGGGVSKLFSEPAYQRDLPAASRRLLAAHRGMPDVASNGSERSPLLTFMDGRWRVAAGTSASAPQWAGLIALADSAAGRDLGPINGALYALLRSPRYGADLRDIVSGSSVGPIRGGTRIGGAAFNAVPGWDPVTGLGTPRAAGLIPDLIRLVAGRQR